MIERVGAADIPVMDRRARGVRVIKLAAGDAVAKVAPIPQTPSELHCGVACGPASRELDLSPSVELVAREVDPNCENCGARLTTTAPTVKAGAR